MEAVEMEVMYSSVPPPHTAGAWLFFPGGRNGQEQEGDGEVVRVLSPAARNTHNQKLSSPENTSLGDGFLFLDRNSKLVDRDRR